MIGDRASPSSTVATYKVLSRIAIAWLITLPVTILVAAGLYYLLASPTLRNPT
jgi:phosphate/sulfate permease